MLLTLIVGLGIGSVVGYFSGYWVHSQRAESEYPWALHHQLNTPPIGCDLFKKSKLGRTFWVEPALNGEGVRLVTYNAAAKTISVSLVGPDHRSASDNWPFSCE